MMNNTNTPEKELTGYPSIDKPWLKYYSEEAINAPLPECTIYEYLWENNKEHLDDVALIYFDRKITYKKLFENIDKATRAFSAVGVRQGDIVTLSVVNIPESVYMVYALNRIGAIANMIDPRTSIDGLQKYISEVKSKIVVTIDLAYPTIIKATKNTDVQRIIVCSVKDSMPSLIKVLYSLKNKMITIEEKSLWYNDFIQLGKNSTAQLSKYQKDNCCVIAHTGGTTGYPKGVMLSNDNINAVTLGYRHLGILFERRAKYFNDLPPFIMYGLCLAMHTTLCFGFQVIIYPIFDSVNFPKQFKKYKPQHFSELPDHLHYLSTSKLTKDLDLSFLIAPAVGGDTLSEDLEIKVNKYLLEHGNKSGVIKGYGMTETASSVVGTVPQANKIGSAGAPLVTNILKIMDIDTNQEKKYNQIGEIWINSPSTMLSYYNNQKETNELIVTDENGKRWVRTGDLGYIDEDGQLFHKGRIRRIYLTTFDGQPAKIFPMMVEETINYTDDVVDSSVVGRKRENSEHCEAVAFIVIKKGTLVDEVLNAIKANCAEKLPTYMVPTEYRFIDRIPLTPIGKVDFILLEKMAENQDKGERL